MNWFGLFKEDSGLGITVEINTAFVGRNDHIAGFFARDTRTGAVYLMHSGRVGGGRGTRVEPGEGTLVETRRQVESGWRTLADKLAKDGHPDLARDVQRFVNRMRTVRTERELIAHGLLERVRDPHFNEKTITR